MAFDPFLERLNSLLRGYADDGRLGIAFSGGLDSRFLTHMAVASGIDPVLLHCSGPHIAPAETAYAKNWAKRRGLRFTELSLDPLGLEAVRDNSEERCYSCKHMLYSAMIAHLNPVCELPAGEIRGPFPGIPLCDGSNLSDRLAYRPGMKASHELGVRSPLAEAGLDKTRIRELAVRTGLDNPEQRARPCLLTRLAYGMPPSADLLGRLARAEEAIEGLLHAAGEANPDFRLRWPEEGCVELHTLTDISETARSAIADAVRASDLPAPLFRRVETLSGYYDTQQADTAEADG